MVAGARRRARSHPFATGAESPATTIDDTHASTATHEPEVPRPSPPSSSPAPAGFVGSHALPALLAAGHQVRALVRDARGAEAVRGRLTPTQASVVSIVIGDIGQPSTLAPALAGVDAVVHLVAIPRDNSGGADLERVNTEGTHNVIAAMTAAGVSRLVHLSAMGVVDDPSLHYASSKAQADAAVRASSLRWTILKPSLLWGERDGFFNIVASLVRISPGIVPVPGGRASRFQPLGVDDLARVVVGCLERDDTVGHSYDLGGPEYWTYREMVAEVIAAMGKKRVLLTCRCRSSRPWHAPPSCCTCPSRWPATSCASWPSTMPPGWATWSATSGSRRDRCAAASATCGRVASSRSRR